jgi:hypothetical protein
MWSLLTIGFIKTVNIADTGASAQTSRSLTGIPYRGPFRFWISIVGVSAF